MLGMTGRQLCDEALKQRRDLKALYTTGYTRDAVVHNGVDNPRVHLLPKPFTLDQVAQHCARFSVPDQSTSRASSIPVYGAAGVASGGCCAASLR